MDRRTFITSSAVGLAGIGAHPAALAASTPQASHRQGRKILIAGGGFRTAFVRYMAELTGKPRPRLLYLPTASADRPDGIIRWYQDCAPLDVEPSHQESFISSYRMDRSWEDVLLSVDGIVVSGGNTLNQQVIWKAQGIDLLLREAWDRGIVLGGASAGSLCWFEEGTTDSRPQVVTKIECLGFLQGSHSPHYDAEEVRRPTYHRMIRSGELKPGWACDNDAGIYFEDNEPRRFVATRDGARVYHVRMQGGDVMEEGFNPERIA